MTAGTDAITKLPVKDQLRQGFKEMGKASWSSAKNFGLVGSIFAGTECCIEGVRWIFITKVHRSMLTKQPHSSAPRTIYTMVWQLAASQAALLLPKPVLRPPLSAALVSPVSVPLSITTCACRMMIPPPTRSLRYPGRPVPSVILGAFWVLRKMALKGIVGLTDHMEYLWRTKREILTLVLFWWKISACSGCSEYAYTTLPTAYRSPTTSAVLTRSSCIRPASAQS